MLVLHSLGIYGVGKAAVHPPALAVLSHMPQGSDGVNIAWVGKGIVYDTGGLSIKGKVNFGINYVEILVVKLSRTKECNEKFAKKISSGIYCC